MAPVVKTDAAKTRLRDLYHQVKKMKKHGHTQANIFSVITQGKNILVSSATFPLLRNIVYDDEKFNVQVDKDADAKVDKYADATTSGDDSDPKTPVLKTQVKIKPGARTPSKPTPTKAMVDKEGMGSRD